MPLFNPNIAAIDPTTKVAELKNSDFVTPLGYRNVNILRNASGKKYYKVTSTAANKVIILYEDEGAEGAELQFFIAEGTGGAMLAVFPNASYAANENLSGTASLTGGGEGQVFIARRVNSSWDVTVVAPVGSSFAPDGTLKSVEAGTSKLVGEGGTIRMNDNTAIFGPNTIYVEGNTPGADVNLLFRDGLYLGTFTGDDGMGNWEPAIIFSPNGLSLGSPNMTANKSTTIHGGEYGINLNPGSETAPVAINGRGDVAVYNPGIGGPIASNYAGVKGMVGYFGGYMYLCVDTNTWVRAAVETSW